MYNDYPCVIEEKAKEQEIEWLAQGQRLWGEGFWSKTQTLRSRPYAPNYHTVPLAMCYQAAWQDKKWYCEQYHSFGCNGQHSLAKHNYQG